METLIYIKNNDYRLFGVIHKANIINANSDGKNNDRKNIGVVFCNPFGEEKMIAHRAMVNMARRLAEKGYFVLRFDYMGNGDSEGNFEDSTIKTNLADIQCAINYLKTEEELKVIGLLGIRFGATLAILAGKRHPHIDFCIFVSPIMDGNAYARKLLRSNLSTQMALHKKVIKDREKLIEELMEGKMVNVDGYLLSKEIYQEMIAIKLHNEDILSIRKALLINAGGSGETTGAGIGSLKITKGQIEPITLKEETFWKDLKTYIPRARKLEDCIVAWLGKTYPL